MKTFYCSLLARSSKTFTFFLLGLLLCFSARTFAQTSGTNLVLRVIVNGVVYNYNEGACGYGTADFGGAVTQGFCKPVAWGYDITPDSVGCDSIPAGQLTGKIAMIRRGTCEFGCKILNAEKAGAMAVLIANHSTQGDDCYVQGMSGGSCGPSVTIPAIFVCRNIANQIDTAIIAGQTLEVCFLLPDDADNDGYTVEEGDCHDSNAAIHPGALEICGNGMDDDCDGLTDEEYTQIKIHKDGQQNVSCYGGSDGSVNIHATGGQTPYSFEWSNGATTEDASGLPAGTHTVTVVDAQGRCRTKSFTLTQPNQLTLTFTHVDVSCHGGSDGEATAQPSGGSGNKTYLWSNGKTTKKIKDMTAGTYSVTVTDSKGCTAVGSVAVGEPTELLITNVTVTPVEGLYKLTVSAIGGNQPYKYRRSKPNGNWTNWQTSNVLTNVPAGVYTIQVKDNNACTASATVNVPGGMLLPPGGADDRTEPQVSNDNPNREKALSELGDALLLYPNPARNQLSLLKKDYAGKKAVVTITNNLGVPMLRQEVEAMPADALTLDLSSFQDGLYFLTISAEGFPAVTKRFVVVR